MGLLYIREARSIWLVSSGIEQALQFKHSHPYIHLSFRALECADVAGGTSCIDYRALRF